MKNKRTTNKRRTFKTHNKDELIKLIHDMAKSITPSILATEHPFIIYINGDNSAGKSLFWDEITKTILGQSAQRKRSLLNMSFSNARHYENWHGKDTRNGANTHITFANMNSAPTRITRKLRASWAETKSSAKTKKSGQPTNIFIVSASPMPRIDKDVPTLKINVKFSPKSTMSSWKRTTTLEIKNQALQASEKFNDFLENHPT